MKIIEMTCPRCRGNLNIKEEGRTKICEYCGLPLYFDDEARTITINTVDFASMFKTASNERLAMDQREREDKKRRHIWMLIGLYFLVCIIAGLIALYSSNVQISAVCSSVFVAMAGIPIAIGLYKFISTRDDNDARVVLIIAILMLVTAIPGVYSGKMSSHRHQTLLDKGYISSPLSSSAAKEENYTNIVTAFKAAGFTNVTAEGKGDLIFGIQYSEGSVYEISINGETSFGRGEMFSPDAVVRIVYHSF